VCSDGQVKIRIGVGFGASVGPAEFGDTVDRLEAAGVDSLWLSENVYSEMVEPFIGMAHALARTRHLKVGTGVAVLPGRNPVLVAKQLATLAGLTPARVLPVFGLRPARRKEAALFDVPQGKRAEVFDESLTLLKLMFEQEEVTFSGRYFTVERASIGPKPAKPLDIWLGGSAPAGLRRVGRLADGWLASFLTPEEARDGRKAIEAAAAEAGRQIEDDHYGISIPVTTGDIPGDTIAAIAQRNPDTDPAELVATGWSHARELVERYIDAGLSKFVIRPIGAAQSFESFLDGLAEHLMPIEN
jgi:probable F420-dependent oxidoreductase